MTGSGRIAVFAYGSLVAPGSAARTLGRPVSPDWPPEEAHPATLSGWRRRYSLARDNRTCEKTFARDADGSIPDVVLSLNVERTGATGDSLNGLLIVVSEHELLRLDARELRYDRVEVEPSPARGDLSRIYTYTAKSGNFAPEPPPGAVILRSYAKAVYDAFAQLGPEQLAAYLASTGEPPLTPIGAHLVRDRIPPGNPRAW